MKTILQKAAVIFLMVIPSVFSSQVDLTIGLNYAYNPPTGCNNQITSLSVDICNNGSAAAGAFIVGVYLYDPSSSNHWVIASTNLNSLSGNACQTISNWNIDMNNYCCLPAPGSNYRIGVWADTANDITETNKNNNASLLSGNIQVCASSTGIRTIQKAITQLDLFPNPTNKDSELLLSLSQEAKLNIAIYDVTGHLVSNTFNGNLPSGDQKINLQTSSLPNGVYFVAVNSTSESTRRKLIVQK
jgi:hypothetical protein